MMSNASSTNRVLEKTKTILDLIKASKKDISFFVQVSLDGKEQTHDHVRGVTGEVAKYAGFKIKNLTQLPTKTEQTA